MKLLLIGQADSIFFEHYSKNLKAQNPGISIEAFSVDAINGRYDLSACDVIYESNWDNSILSKLRGIRILIRPFYIWASLSKFLSRRNIKYDIIHIKWLLPDVILRPGIFARHCRKLVATLWGTEYETNSIWFSKSIYLILLKRFLQKADIITYFTEEKREALIKLGTPPEKLSYAIYGSSICEELEKLALTETRSESKKNLGLNPGKITISIGYSGKPLHQHVPIIHALCGNPLFAEARDRFLIILPMNYGCTDEYRENVKEEIKPYNIDYWVHDQALTDKEIARLRQATDIMIQLSANDSRSASIVESFVAGSILIIGKWLPYQVFRDKKLYYHELTDINSSLPELILRLSENIVKEFEKCQDNKYRWDDETWAKEIKSWMAIYDKLLIRENFMQDSA